ncbi:tyrosine-type recombinase/integrase [Maritalea sp. S77]|uniref:tyrosine-type recombinase/integrase n=1 Tax=Maritalea sp. S77 TaxID=3415125 RepID=UPI003C7A593F
MAVKLTKTLVEGLEPSTKDIVKWDSEVKGFGVKVSEKGTKSYFVYYRTTSGQQRRPSIGRHGTFTVEQARKIARQWLAEVALGKDISAIRQNDRQAETVNQLAQRYLKDYAEIHKKPRSIQTDKANIENHVIPLIGKMKVKDVTRADIERLKLDIREGKTARKLSAKPRGRRQIRGGEGIANRVLALLSKMFGCAIDWNLRTDNPAMGIKKFRENKKDRFLSEAEIGRLLEALDTADRVPKELPAATAGIRLLLFTGLRVGEIVNLDWQHVDMARGTIFLPDSKTGSRLVPLNSMALDVLKSLYRDQQSGLVLESSAAGKPIALTRPWYRIRESAQIDKTATLHSLRHTFASHSVMTGQSLAQAGSLLGHKSAQTTMRYAHHLLEAQRQYSEQTGDVFRRIAGKSADQT